MDDLESYKYNPEYPNSVHADCGQPFDVCYCSFMED